MPFHEVLQQPHKRFIDVIGIVIHLAPLEHIGGRPYREAILMDSRSLIYNTIFFKLQTCYILFKQYKLC
ncbi:hypothetical protein ZEAMMB73_Zm00001d006241, partial [Zea mays]